MPRKAASLESSSSTNERLEPRLLRAVEANDLVKVKETIQEAQTISYGNPHFLDIGLARACDRNIVDAVRFLLSRGADPNYTSGNKLVPLRRTAESGFVEIVRTLLDHGANREACDKKGRTALMTAAWKDHFPIVKLLLDRGANIHTVDHRRRNVLHNIAADKAQRRCSTEIVEFLLQSGINLDAKDELGRTALHWACVTDHEVLLRSLLAASPTSSILGSQVNSVDSRMKTPLHLAASHNREHLAKILIEGNAYVMAKSDGGWTPLHNACTNGPPSMIKLLLQYGADANSELLNGRTPLHVAAEHGNVDAAKCLLEQPHIRRAVKDRFGNTPLLIAAQHRQKDIVEILAPWNHLEGLTVDEIEAAKRFDATIVDFGNFRNENKVTRRSVYDLLYVRDSQETSQHLISTLVQNVKATNFRWIHLPANNIAWCDTLLTKRFVEEEARDVEGYKALQASFSHQHQGQQHHARFLRPMCQTVNRTETEDKRPETPARVVHEATPALLETPDRTVISPEPPDVSSTSIPRGNERRGLAKLEPKSPTTGKENKPRQTGVPTRQQDQSRPPRHVPSTRQSRNSDKLVRSPSRRGGFNNPCYIYFFMPYLHFETDKNRRAMRQAMEQPNHLRSITGLNQDEVLVRAHLAASSSFLHVRRTLDQFFYHNIDTDLRDCDQVVYRFQKQHRKPPDRDPKIFMVDQLWMWVLGKDLVVTSFPQRWQQPRNDPLNVLEGIIEEINSKTREPVQNVFELAMTIAGRCFGTFDRHRKGDEEFQFLDMFEASIGSAMDREANLFRQFSDASRQASLWLKEQSRPSKLARSPGAAAKAGENSGTDNRHSEELEDAQEPLFVDRLLDVGPETDLLAEIKNIREELDIIRMVLGHQEHLLPELKDAIRSIYKDERSHGQLKKVEKKFEEQEKTVINPLKDIDRMDKQAERIYGSIRDLLDLKQKHANAFEARFARDQAQGTVRQGRTIMVFTVVTVIFLPLSFIAGFFAINVESYPHRSDGQIEMPLSYVSEYTFGIGLAISIPLILIALSVDELGYGYGKVRQWVGKKWLKMTRRDGHEEEVRQRETLQIEESLSKAKSLRKSAEESWNRRIALPIRQETGMYNDERTSTRRASRPSWDVERDLQLS